MNANTNANADVKVTEGLYVFLGDKDLVGRIIGREGRNVRALEDEAKVTIDIKELFAWVGGDTPDDELMVASLLWALSKVPTAWVNPGLFQRCLAVLKEGMKETKDPVELAYSLSFFLV